MFADYVAFAAKIILQSGVLELGAHQPGLRFHVRLRHASSSSAPPPRLLSAASAVGPLAGLLTELGGGGRGQRRPCARGAAPEEGRGRSWGTPPPGPQRERERRSAPAHRREAGGGVEEVVEGERKIGEGFCGSKN